MADVARFHQDENVYGLNYADQTTTVLRGHDALLPLVGPMRTLAEEANKAAETTKDSAMAEVLRAQLLSKMIEAGSRTYRSSLHFRREQYQKVREYETPAENIDRKHDVERRDRFRGLDPAQAAGAVNGADLADLTALVADGNLAQLQPDIFDLAKRRFLQLNVIAREGLAAHYARKPSLGNILAPGVDYQAAERAADMILQGVEAGREVNAIHERALRDYIVVMSKALDVPAKDILDRIIAA